MGGVSGPIARASGIRKDARSSNKFYTELGFTILTSTAGDTYARLQLRLDEIKQSFRLIEKAAISSDSLFKKIMLVSESSMDTNNASGQAIIETPRGQARLQLTLENGQVTSAQLETPSTQHLTFIEPLTDQQELGSALLAVGSLDLSPWEIQQ